MPELTKLYKWIVCFFSVVTDYIHKRPKLQTSDIGLYAAGKRGAVVIGHSTKANPGYHPGQGKKDDYRHGARTVYHNGTILFTTESDGRIKRKVVDYYLKLKTSQGDKYDGTKQVYKAH